jgi:DNA-binding SARP family transcriptional activator/tetratricopeptide (TPR) repeat protein
MRVRLLLLETRATALVDGLAAPVALATRDAVLLAWLALSGPTQRAQLASLMWPDRSDELARNSLRQRLFQLRRQCGVDVAAGNPLLALADGVTHNLAEAPTLLGTLALPDCPALDAWLQEERGRRLRLERQRLAPVLEALESSADWPAAVALAEHLVALEPLSEEAHRRLMRLHYLRGDRAAALLAFDRLENHLKHEVGTTPDATTRSLLATIERAQPLPASAAASNARRVAPPPAAVLRPPRMVGRERELASLRADAASASVTLVLGDAGLGKSRLLQAYIDEARNAAVALPVLSAARPGDGLSPFATLARVLRELLRAAPQARAASGDVELAALLGEGPPTAGAMSPGPTAPLTAVRAVLAQAATDVSALLLDDLHFADDATLDLLQELAGASPLRLVLAMRPAAPGSRCDTLRQTLTEGGALAPLLLTPLDAPRMAELVDSLGLPGIDGAALAPLLVQRTGGNPLFALETLKLAWQEGTLGHPADLPRPASVGQLIGQQLALLTPDALALARVAALADVDFSLELASAVLGRDVLQLTDAWSELESRQVLRGSAFAHDLVYETVLAGVPEVIARHLHGQMAAWLETQAGEPARVAAHWQAAGRLEQALPGLRAAAERAHRAWRENERIEFLLRAADIAQASGRQAEAFECVHSAVEAHMNMLSQADGFPLLDRLEQLAHTPLEQAIAARERAYYCAHLTAWPAAAAAAERALVLAQSSGDASLTATVRQRLGTSLAMVGRFDEALAHLLAVEAWFEQQASPDDLGEFHGNLAVVLDNAGRADEALRHHRRAIDDAARRAAHAQHATVLANLAVNRLAAGDVPGAREPLVLAQHLVTSYELQGSTAAHICLLQAQCARAVGEFTRALGLLDHALKLVAARKAVLVPLVQLHTAHCWLDLGQQARAQQALVEVAAAAQLPARIRARLGLLQARLARALGHDATGALDQALASAPTTGWPDVLLAVRIECAALRSTPAAALAELAEISASAGRRGLAGTALAAELRACELALASDAEVAARHARRAGALAVTAEALYLPRAERWLWPARALLAAGHRDEARSLAEIGQRWLRNCATHHVDTAFVDSFLQRNPQHAALLAIG